MRRRLAVSFRGFVNANLFRFIIARFPHLDRLETNHDRAKTCPKISLNPATGNCLIIFLPPLQ